MKHINKKYETRTHSESKLTAQFDSLRNKSGHEGTFRMVISHLFQEGFAACQAMSEETLSNYLQDERIKEENLLKEKALKEAKGEQVKRNLPIITPEFVVELWRLAREWAQFPMWEVIKYLQNYVFIGR